MVATVRDCATTLQSDISNLQTALGLFKNVHWFIVESDSTDDTLLVLRQLSDTVPNFDYATLGQVAHLIPLRTARIAHSRNRYLEELRFNPTLSDAKLCVMADLDGAQSLLTREGLMSCFEREDWGVCTSNQQGLYYDIWALRHPVWSPNDCWELNTFLQRHKMQGDKARFSAVFSRMIEIPTSSPWIEVDSAFGGLAVYKTEFMGQARYVGANDRGVQGGQVCEHVAFHQELKASGAKIFINPRMVNTSLNQHTTQIVVPDDLTFPIGVKTEKGDPPKEPTQSTDVTQQESNAQAEDAPSEERLGQLDVMNMTPEDVIAAYKLFLKRHPESMNVVYPRVGMTTDMVLVDFLTSEEFLKRSGVDRLLAGMQVKLNALTAK